MGDLLGIDDLLPRLMLGVGLALIVGNGLAWWKHRRGQPPPEMEEAHYRPGRVVFLILVGVVITAWAAVSLITSSSA